MEASDLLDQIDLACQVIPPRGNFKSQSSFTSDLFQPQLGKKSGDTGIIKIDAEKRANTIAA